MLNTHLSTNHCHCTTQTIQISTRQTTIAGMMPSGALFLQQMNNLCLVITAASHHNSMYHLAMCINLPHVPLLHTTIAADRAPEGNCFTKLSIWPKTGVPKPVTTSHPSVQSNPSPNFMMDISPILLFPTITSKKPD